MFAAHTVFIFVLLRAALLGLPTYCGTPGDTVLPRWHSALWPYLLARRLLRSTTLATLLAAAYLLNPAIQQGTNQFHVEAFEADIGFAIYAAVVWRPPAPRWYGYFCFTVQTGRPSFVVPLGLWVALRRDHNTGAGNNAQAWWSGCSRT